VRGASLTGRRDEQLRLLALSTWLVAMSALLAAGCDEYTSPEESRRQAQQASAVALFWGGGFLTAAIVVLSVGRRGAPVVIGGVLTVLGIFFWLGGWHDSLMPLVALMSPMVLVALVLLIRRIRGMPGRRPPDRSPPADPAPRQTTPATTPPRCPACGGLLRAGLTVCPKCHQPTVSDGATTGASPRSG